MTYGSVSMPDPRELFRPGALGLRATSARGLVQNAWLLNRRARQQGPEDVLHEAERPVEYHVVIEFHTLLPSPSDDGRGEADIVAASVGWRDTPPPT